MVYLTDEETNKALVKESKKSGLRKCIKCGRIICEGRASYFQPPFSDMCNYHRIEALKEKYEKDENCKGAKN